MKNKSGIKELSKETQDLINQLNKNYKNDFSIINFAELNRSTNGFKNVQKDVLELVHTVSAAGGGFSDFENKLKNLTNPLATFGSTLKSALAGAGYALAVNAAISGIVYLADKLIVTRAEIEEAAMAAQASVAQTQSAFNNMSSTMNDVKGRYAELAQGVQIFGNEIKNVNLSPDDLKSNMFASISTDTPFMMLSDETRGDSNHPLFTKQNEDKLYFFNLMRTSYRTIRTASAFKHVPTRRKTQRILRLFYNSSANLILRPSDSDSLSAAVRRKSPNQLRLSRCLLLRLPWRPKSQVPTFFNGF